MRQTAVNMVETLARKDERVVFIGSDLSPGLLASMRADLPERFFMEGVSEQHVIGMAAGMAMEGFIPYVNTIATFLTRRCFDQLAIDVCMENLPVRLLANGGGLVYAPLGPTHLAFEDIAILRALPNMAIVAPCDAEEMRRLMEASLSWPGPLYIRIAKGGDPVISDPGHGFAIGKAIALAPAGEVAFIATGVMSGRAVQAARLLREESGITAGVLHCHTVKPLDEAAVRAAAAGARLVVTVEEHTRIGGLGSAVADLLAEDDHRPPMLRLALADAYPEGYGSQDHLLRQAGLHPERIAERVRTRLAG